MDSEYIGWRLEVVVAVLLPLQFIFVALRFHSRKLSGRVYGLDDVLIVVSLLSQCVLAGIAIGSVKQAGVGYHVGYLAKTDPEAITNFFKYLVAISSWYVLTISIPKLAILIVYRRLFPQQTIFVCICILHAILILNSVIGVFILAFACRPFHLNWASTAVQHEKCLDKRAFFVWFSFPSIVTDVAMMVLPLPVIWKLRMTRHNKIALTVTFVMGGSGLAASLVRFFGFLDTNSFVDATYNAVVLIIWTFTEPCLYLIAACMMMYRPLLEKVLHITNLKSRTGGGTGMASNKSLRSREGIEMGSRSQGTRHGFERLVEVNHSEEAGVDLDPAHIRVRTDFKIQSGLKDS